MIKNISFKDDELYLFDYAKKNGGLSFFVKKLIRDHMDGLTTPSPQPTLSDEQIEMMNMMAQMKKLLNGNQAPQEESSKEVPKNNKDEKIIPSDLGDSILDGIE